MIRVSGPDAHEAVTRLAGAVPADRRLRLRMLRHGSDTIDQALVAAFPVATSPTGEPAAELHLHGGLAVIAAVEARLAATPGLRLARPGEFARRALAAGKLDVTQAEGLAALIDAETEAQRRHALRALRGEVSATVRNWRERLLRAWSLLEACIDFVDEDLPADVVASAQAEIGALAAEVAREAAGAAAARSLRDGFEVAVVGPPNAGKSSLVNALAGRDVALTAPTPGTTRDVIETRIDVNGYLAVLLDTAGLRDAHDPVEAAGVGLARRRAAEADLVLWVEAPDARAAEPAPSGALRVWCKADLGAGPGLAVSTVTGEGIPALWEALGAQLRARLVGAGPVASARQAAWLAQAGEALGAAVALPAELAVEELRRASEALDGLLGRVDAEDVLDEIFARFCIGK